MITSVLPTSWTELVVSAGVPLFVMLFYFDGMMLGKFTPPGALFFGYVVVVDPPLLVLSTVVGLCVAASTLGQWTLYRGFNEDRPELIGIRRRMPYLNRLPFFIRRKVGKRWMRFVTRAFDRFGGLALCLTNAVPGMGGLMSIPAGLSKYPLARFLVFATVGNVFYMLLLVAAAKGLVDLF
ncbi:MAG: membrane-associated protein [Halorubrum sp.]|uniref:DedA family protein n=1 Tax=Halorubrum sp. TaxID=1879286 RepID=UPI003970B9CF